MKPPSMTFASVMVMAVPFLSVPVMRSTCRCSASNNAFTAFVIGYITVLRLLYRSMILKDTVDMPSNRLYVVTCLSPT